MSDELDRTFERVIGSSSLVRLDQVGTPTDAAREGNRRTQTGSSSDDRRHIDWGSGRRSSRLTLAIQDESSVGTSTARLALPNSGITGERARVIPSGDMQRNSGVVQGVLGSAGLPRGTIQNEVRRLFRSTSRSAVPLSTWAVAQSRPAAVGQPPKKKGRPSGRDFVKDVFLLDLKDDKVPRDRGQFYDNDRVSNGITFSTSMTEDDIARVIMNLFPSLNQLPLPRFEFVKVVNCNVHAARVTSAYVWDGVALKHFSGQGQVYVRSLHPLPTKDSGPDEKTVAEEERPPAIEDETAQQHRLPSPHESPQRCPSEQPPQPSPPSSPPVIDIDSWVDEEACMSTADEGKIEQLRSIFGESAPSRDAIRQLLSACAGNVNEAANMFFATTQKDDDDDGGSSPSQPSSGSALELSVGGCLDDSMPNVRLAVDRNEPIFPQALTFYKSPSADLRRRLNVSFEGELGIDQGGPAKDFFESVHNAILTNENGVRLIEGTEENRWPIHDTSALSCGMFKILGKVFGHSIVHGATALPGLSVAAVAYIVSGDIDLAIQKLTFEDICDPDLRDVVHQIMHAETRKEVESVVTAEVWQILASSGFNDLQIDMENRAAAAQVVVVHDTLLKRKAELDDIREGMAEVHDVFGRDLITYLDKYAHVVDLVFPRSYANLRGQKILEVVTFADTGRPSTEIDQAKDYFVRFINKLESVKDPDANLGHLLRFWTGMSQLPTMGRGLDVAYLADQGSLLIAQTCFNRLLIPVSHRSFDSFDQAARMSLTKGCGFGLF